MLWEAFEEMARREGASVDHLINESMLARYNSAPRFAGAQGGQQQGGDFGYQQPPPPPPPGYGQSGFGGAPGGRVPPPPGMPPPLPFPGAPAGPQNRPPSMRPAPPPPPPPRANSVPPPPPAYGQQQPSFGNQGFGNPPPPPPPGYGAGPQYGAPAPYMPPNPPQPQGFPPPPPPPPPPQGGGFGQAPFGGAAPQPGGALHVIYQGQRTHVNKDRFILGRGKQSSDLTIKDPNVSRQHAMVELLNGQYYMVDMGSTNGVEFNGQRIGRKVIAEGDLFRICDHEVRFTYR